MSRRVLETLIGVSLLGVGVFIAIEVDNRGDILIIFFVALGGFLVSKSLITEFFQSIWNTFRR